MREVPILFSGPMVRAILDGRKTMTRRALKPQPYIDGQGNFCAPDRKGRIWNWGQHFDGKPCTRNYQDKHTRWRVGDHLWLRESYYQYGHWEPVPNALTKGDKQKWRFIADDPLIVFDEPLFYCTSMHRIAPNISTWHKRLGRFMPRSASRITLLVEAVRVERLRDISEADAVAEGIYWSDIMEGWTSGAGVDESCDFHGRWASKAYAKLWTRINGDEGPGAWRANPWVSVTTFRRLPSNPTQQGDRIDVG